jgi:hypothetical protein
MKIKDYIFWVVIALMVIPMATARQDSWETLGMRVDHHFPDTTVEQGATFWAGGEAHEIGQPVDQVQWSDLQYSGCELVQLNESLADGVHAWRAKFLMTSPTCTWTRLAEGVDGTLNLGQIETFVYATGSVSAYQATSEEQDMTRSLTGFFAPLIIFLGLIMFAAWHGWRFVLIGGVIGFTGLFMDIGIADTGAYWIVLLGVFLEYYLRNRDLVKGE